MQNRAGATQYDIDVFINEKFVKTVRSRDAQTIVEVTPYMFVGANRAVTTTRLAPTNMYGVTSTIVCASRERTVLTNFSLMNTSMSYWVAPARFCMETRK